MILRERLRRNTNVKCQKISMRHPPSDDGFRSPSALTVWATKPKGKVAAILAQMGVAIAPIEHDEGNVDRYVLSKRLVIERRTGGNFLRGIVDKTLYTSAIYLREHFSVPLLFVEGEVNLEYSSFHPQAVRGAISSMMLQYGLSVVSTPNAEETAKLIAMAARQEQTGISDISLVPKRKAKDLADMQRRIIEMLPGCGMVIARDLLQHFGNVKRIMDATEGELRSAPGIGAKKALEIHNVLNAEYGSVDTERNLEDAIASEPRLLFEHPINLVARQHHIYSDEKERHIVDMVFADPDADHLILVELKRGVIKGEHHDQLKRYLDNAHKSRLLRTFLDKGMKIHGILATVEGREKKPRDPNITVRIVDKREVIEVLKRIRDRRLQTLGN